MLPSANADAPTSLSSLLLLGCHVIGESTYEVDLPRRERPEVGGGNSLRHALPP